MSEEIIYTDGSCVGNGSSRSKGGFGLYIESSSMFSAPCKIGRKGETAEGDGETYYVTNIRMEGLAIVSTLALYAQKLSYSTSYDPIEILNSVDVYNVSTVPTGATKRLDCDKITIVTDSQFWINVIQKWMPNWIKKNIINEKKNPDILNILKEYVRWYKENGVDINFVFVRSHQKGKRTEHADSNDIVDIIAKEAASNKSTKYESS